MKHIKTLTFPKRADHNANHIVYEFIFGPLNVMISVFGSKKS